MTLRHTCVLLLISLTLLAARSPSPSEQTRSIDSRISDASFDAVRAILEQHCNACHSGPRAPRKANFESLENMLVERAGRPVLIVPGKPEASELYRRVTGESEPRMPIDGPPWLTDAEIEVIRAWIASMSAQAPPADPVTPATTQPDPTPTTAPAPPEQSPSSPALSPKPKPTAAEFITFADVRPILATHCMRCHVNNGERGPAPEGLVLTNLESVLRSSERPVVIPGNASASLMIRHIIGTERPRMPFDGPPWLEQDDVRLLTRWIDDGARDEQGRRSSVPAGREVRLEGTLTARWAVDGIAFRIGSEARVRDIRVGGRVEVRAIIQADGSLLATRVRGR